MWGVEVGVFLEVWTGWRRVAHFAKDPPRETAFPAPRCPRVPLRWRQSTRTRCAQPYGRPVLRQLQEELETQGRRPACCRRSAWRLRPEPCHMCGDNADHLGEQGWLLRLARKDLLNASHARPQIYLEPHSATNRPTHATYNSRVPLDRLPMPH